MTSSPGPAGRAAVVAQAAGRARPVTMAGEQLLPVLPPLAPLFPEGGLRRGSTVVVRVVAAGRAGAGVAGARAVGAAARAVGAAGRAEAAGRARPVTMAGEQLLPVLPPLAPLFPEGGLRRGSTVVVRGVAAGRAGAGVAGARAVGAAGRAEAAVGAAGRAEAAAGAAGRAEAAAGGGTTSLGLAVAVAASQAGSWCAAVGWPALGMVAAAGLGMILERFALVPHPGEQWQAVTAALIDAVDVILVTPPGVVRASDARRLTARVRERGVVLIVRGAKGGWPEAADILLSVAPTEWRGLGQGHGYLQARSVEVASSGRGAASRERRVKLWLPGSNGSLGAVSGREHGRADDQETATAASAAG